MQPTLYRPAEMFMCEVVRLLMPVDTSLPFFLPSFPTDDMPMWAWVYVTSKHSRWTQGCVFDERRRSDALTD